MREPTDIFPKPFSFTPVHEVVAHAFGPSIARLNADVLKSSWSVKAQLHGRAEIQKSILSR
jgi:hypothetical protein